MRPSKLLKLPEGIFTNKRVIKGRSYDDFNDAIFYSDLLILKLWQDYIEESKRPGEKMAEDFLFHNETLWIFDWIAQRRGQPTPYMDLARKQKFSHFSGIMKEAIRLLTLPDTTAEERKSAIFSLTCIAQDLEKEDVAATEGLRVSG